MIEYYGHHIEWLPVVGDSQKALYQRIAESLEKDILSGALPIGFKLPPQRLIADYLEINLSTVSKAYNICAQKGLIKGVVGRGTFVQNTAYIPETVLSESTQGVAEMGMLHPLYETNALLDEIMAELTPYFDRKLMYEYSGARGYEKHRHIASKWLVRMNIPASPDHMLITMGAQNALFTVLSALFQSGDAIAVNALTYPGMRNAAMQLGIKLIPIEEDEEGMCAEALEERIGKHAIKGIYLIPDCHNPTGKIMRLERRNALVKIIQKHALKVIEDSVFRFTSDENLPTFYELLPTQCYHIMGISKMINPGFRMAYLLLPKTASTEVIAHHLHNLIFMPSPITAEMAACLQASHRLDGLLALRRKILANRNQIYNKVIESASGNMQNESCAMFRFLPCMNPPSDLEPAFLNAGIQVYSANRFRINEGVGANGVRIALCNARSDEALHALLLRVKGIVQKL